MAVPNLFWSYLGSLIQNLTTQQVDYSYSKIAFMSIGLLLAMYGLKMIQKRAKEQVLLKIPLAVDESSNSSGQLYSPLIQLNLSLHANIESNQASGMSNITSLWSHSDKKRRVNFVNKSF